MNIYRLCAMLVAIYVLNVWTYNDSTGQFTQVSGHGLPSSLYTSGWSVHVDQANEAIILGYTNTSYYPRVMLFIMERY